MTHPPMTQAKDRVANLLWKQDGKPQYGGIGTVGYSHYRDAARTVIDGLIELGYTITSPSRKPSKAMTADQAQGDKA